MKLYVTKNISNTVIYIFFSNNCSPNNFLAIVDWNCKYLTINNNKVNDVYYSSFIIKMIRNIITFYQIFSPKLVEHGALSYKKRSKIQLYIIF